MQRLAIRQFKPLSLFITGVVFLSFVFSLVSSVFLSQPASAAAATYREETDPLTKLKAIKYYNAFIDCSNRFKQTITGEDIAKGPRWWISGGVTSIGLVIDEWDDKNGSSSCAGESDTIIGWLADALELFKLDTSNPESALQALGYTCSTVNNNRECKNANANDEANANGWVQRIRNLSYLNGVDPNSDTLGYNAMTYYGAREGLVKACGGAKGGYSNLVTVTVINANGAIVEETWGLDRSASSRVETSIDPLDDASSSNSDTCSTLARLTADHAKDYQTWAGRAACAETFPDQASNQFFIAGCAIGWANKTDYEACTQIFNNNPSINAAQQKACFLGQEHPVDKDGKTAGELCIAYGYTSNELTACIKGAINRNSPTYCSTVYPAPDSIPIGGSIANDTNKGQRDACEDGQDLEVSSGTTVGDPGNLSDPGDGQTTSCAIPGIGWMICPVFNFLAGLADGIYASVEDLLQTNASIVSTDPTNGTYRGWEIMRNLANIGFVIVFLIIIFSQLSSVGITNYGVKKMLPRLIIAAILVNLSYFVCQLAVDLSNILGASLRDVLRDLPVFDPRLQGDALAQGNWFTNLAAGVLAFQGGAAALTGAAAALYFGGVGLLIPVILAAALAIALTLFILIARQALVVLLVVVSPLAFLAMLLPNTENYFKQWRKVFVAMLLLYPMIALLFGASQVAAGVLLTAFPQSSPFDFRGQLIAAVVMVAPLFLIPSLLSNSLNAIPALGNFATKWQNRANQNASRSGKKRLEQSRLGQYAKYWKGERDLRRAQIQSGTFKGEGARNAFARMGAARNQRLNQVTGKFGSRALAQGDALADAEDAELMKNADSRVTSLSFTDANGIEQKLATKQLIALGSGKDVVDKSGNVLFRSSEFDSHARRAAMVLAGKAANAEEVGMMTDASIGMSALERKTVAGAIRSAPGMSNAPFLGGQVSAAIESTGVTKEQGAVMAIRADKVEPKVLAGGNAFSANLLVDAIKAMPSSTPAEVAAKQDAIDRLKRSYATLKTSTDSTLTSNIIKGGDLDKALQRIDTDI